MVHEVHEHMAQLTHPHTAVRAQLNSTIREAISAWQAAPNYDTSYEVTGAELAETMVKAICDAVRRPVLGATCIVVSRMDGCRPDPLRLILRRTTIFKTEVFEIGTDRLDPVRYVRITDDENNLEFTGVKMLWWHFETAPDFLQQMHSVKIEYLLPKSPRTSNLE